MSDIGLTVAPEANRECGDLFVSVDATRVTGGGCQRPGFEQCRDGVAVPQDEAVLEQCVEILRGVRSHGATIRRRSPVVYSTKVVGGRRPLAYPAVEPRQAGAGGNHPEVSG